MKKAWFKERGYRWGYPISWEGWLATWIYLTLVAWSAYVFKKDTKLVFIILLLVLSIIFILIIKRTTVIDHWRPRSRR